MTGVGKVVALAALLLATGCTSAAPNESELRSMGGCGPVTYDEVRGQRPTYGPDQLTYFTNAQDMCAGRWVPGASEWLVPQGMTVADGTAYVASFDGTKLAGQRLCTMQSMDLETGELIRSRYPVVGRVGPRQPTECRHGGGVVADKHGLWLAETQRLWLLDPDAEAPTGVGADGAGARIVRRARRRRPARAGPLPGGQPCPTLVVRRRRAARLDGVRARRGGRRRRGPDPAGHPGRDLGELGGVGPGLWLARSNTSCGVLVGPDGRSRAFVPGAEGMALTGPDHLWVVSESGSRLYQDKGRPMTPHLARFDTFGITEWQEPTCSP